MYSKRIEVTPFSPHEPIEIFRVEYVKGDIFRAQWKNLDNCKVTFYSSSEEPAYRCGDTVSKSELDIQILEKKMQILSVSITSQNETGDFKGTFTYPNENVLYILPVVSKFGTSTIGKLGLALKDDNASSKWHDIAGKLSFIRSEEHTSELQSR